MVDFLIGMRGTSSRASTIHGRVVACVFFAQYMRNVPIAGRTDEQEATLSRLVEQILADPGSNEVGDIERKIDELVYQLYGLTDAEIELIKQTYRDAGMEI